MESGCEFWDLIPASVDRPEGPQYACRYDIANRMQMDTANLLSLVLKSAEQGRETNAQFIKSGIQNKPTKELNNLLGLSDT